LGGFGLTSLLEICQWRRIKFPRRDTLRYLPIHKDTCVPVASEKLIT
jgi:hypothetical protein